MFLTVVFIIVRTLSWICFADFVAMKLHSHNDGVFFSAISEENLFLTCSVSYCDHFFVISVGALLDAVDRSGEHFFWIPLP